MLQVLLPGLLLSHTMGHLDAVSSTIAARCHPHTRSQAPAPPKQQLDRSKGGLLDGLLLRRDLLLDFLPLLQVTSEIRGDGFESSS